MQKRIARSRAEGERIGRQKAAEENALLQRELGDTRRRLHSIEVGGKVSTEEAAHNAAMKTLESALEKAHTDGNHVEIARLTREMNTKEMAWLDRKRTLLATPAPEVRQERKADTGPAPEGQAWIEANADWYDQPGFEAETAAAIAIDRRLIGEGSDVNSPRHYKKIRKELAQKFRSIKVVDPDDEDGVTQERDDDRRDESGSRRRNDPREPLETDDDEDDDDQDDNRQRGRGDDDEDDDDDQDDQEQRRDDDARGRRRPAFMNMEDSGGGGRRKTLQVRGGKVVLTAADRANMVRFGQDPDNDKHVQNYARTVAEQAEDDE